MGRLVPIVPGALNAYDTSIPDFPETGLFPEDGG
jgi:hypothetical protein